MSSPSPSERRRLLIWDLPYMREHLRRAIRELANEPIITASKVAERAARNIARGRRGVDCEPGELREWAADMLRRRWG